MIVRLMVSNDKANVKKVVLRSDTVIGRSSDCNLRIASREVSRKHCSILLSDRSVRVRDLGSANGTFLNGSQIEANVDVPAPPGSELEVGNVRFVISYDPPVPSELEASTAEVPNAVLAARLAQTSRTADADADDRQRVVPREDPPSERNESSAAALDGPAAPEGCAAGHPSSPAAAHPSAAAVDPQIDTYRGDPGETLRDAPSPEDTFNAADPDDEGDSTVDGYVDRPVDDDTFALKESDAADSPAESEAAEAELPAADETISMRVEDVRIDTGTAPAAPSTESAKEQPRGGWKSMFGLLGGKKGKPAEAKPEQTPPAASPTVEDDPDVANRLEPAPDERGPDPERNRKTVPEFTLPEGSAGSPDDTIQFSADESISPPAGKPPAEPDAGDTNLQDFFKQMSKE